jgi:hypothetical protein
MSALLLPILETFTRWTETQREAPPERRGAVSGRVLTLTHAEYDRLRQTPDFTDLALKDTAKAHGFDSVVVSG